MKTTSSQTERLLVVSEQCGRAVEKVSNVLRFGYTEEDKEGLENALGDLLESAGRLAERGDISWTKVMEQVQSH